MLMGCMKNHAIIAISILLLEHPLSQAWAFKSIDYPCRRTARARLTFSNKIVATKYRRASSPTSSSIAASTTNANADYDYDLVIIGAGASGLMASGAAGLLGSKTLLLDTLANGNSSSSFSNIGGDCTNAACVPSKAVRSIARQAATSPSEISNNNPQPFDWFQRARKHATDTVNTVRKREDPVAMTERNPNLDIAIVTNCHFTSSQELLLTPQAFYTCEEEDNNLQHRQMQSRFQMAVAENSDVTIRTKKIILAVGAQPYIPPQLKVDAQRANVPIFTYQTVYRPTIAKNAVDAPSSLWDILEGTDNNATQTKKIKRVAIVGGGATGLEIAQALGRLSSRNRDKVRIIMIAPQLLGDEDVALQAAAVKIMQYKDASLDLCLNCRLDSIDPQGKLRLSDGNILDAVDAIVMCTGRRPVLDSLQLSAANIEWTPKNGVIVNDKTLQSVSTPHVFACGDCASAVATRPKSRSAAHAGWTGFQASLNTKIPAWVRWGNDRSSFHPTVPRVIYTDPELASVGLTHAECILKYGSDGIDRVNAAEFGTDRADMEREERSANIGFVELRARRSDGLILGFSGCGPHASELANEMGLAIQQTLTVRDVANAIHSYPSHGYLLHRVALSMTLSSTWNIIEAIGPIPATISNTVRFLVNQVGSLVQLPNAIITRQEEEEKRRWEARGASKALISKKVQNHEDETGGQSLGGTSQLVSYLDIYNDPELCRQLSEGNKEVLQLYQKTSLDNFLTWLREIPSSRKQSKMSVNIVE